MDMSRQPKRTWRHQRGSQRGAIWILFRPLAIIITTTLWVHPIKCHLDLPTLQNITHLTTVLNPVRTTKPRQWLLLFRRLTLIHIHIITPRCHIMKLPVPGITARRWQATFRYRDTILRHIFITKIRATWVLTESPGTVHRITQRTNHIQVTMVTCNIRVYRQRNAIDGNAVTCHSRRRNDVFTTACLFKLSPHRLESGQEEKWLPRWNHHNDYPHHHVTPYYRQHQLLSCMLAVAFNLIKL